jgi:ribA/ribD-fused uncharacterized protein
VIKAAGRAVLGFKEEIWLNRRFAIAVMGDLHKFQQNPSLGEYLLGPQRCVLPDSRPVDYVWEIGMKVTDPVTEMPAQWPDTNLLGFALMEVRSRLMNSQACP